MQRRQDDAEGINAVAPQTSLYTALIEQQGFHFEPGDVVLLRSAELMSSAISQIGAQPTFFSHVALIGLDPQWKDLEVIEAGVQDGLRTVELDDWLDRDFVRVAVYRHRDATLAAHAAIAAYEDAESRTEDRRRYDFQLALDDHARLYCSEVVTQAYALADPQAPRVPPRLSDVGNLVETFPLNAFGAHEAQVFLPDDLELDANFTRMIEVRVPAQLAVTAAMDRVFRELFDGLRGPQRSRVLAAIDALQPTEPVVVPIMLRSSFSAYRQLPAAAQSRLVGLSRWIRRALPDAVVEGE